MQRSICRKVPLSFDQCKPRNAALLCKSCISSGSVFTPLLDKFVVLRSVAITKSLRYRSVVVQSQLR